ncbi:MAG: hypothetical protein CMJ12_01135 [Pelagibacterales bacterium]|nr:hypothetical protein [Pelagibacterales bacterium]PPR16621.1 MAG: hypothetical protein CFH33_00525 [Alphaproteobacteria bacterium MarineAlpha9_Bin3]
MISEALASIIFSININAILIRDYSEVKDKITSKTIALLIDENIINKGKRIHIKSLKDRSKVDIPIFCVVENLSEANAYNSFMHFYQKPIDKNTLHNALMPYFSNSNFNNINSTIKVGKFNFDQNLKTLSDEKNNLINLTNLEARLLLILYKNLNNTLKEDFLLKQVWGYSSNANSNTIKTHIWRLRKKIYNNDENIFNLETTANGYVLKQKIL